MEIQHFSHEHPLMFTEDHHKLGHHDEDGKLRCCYGCLDPIFSTPSYSCSIQGCEFWLHKSCAELPREIEHPLHPKHPLTLFAKSPYGSGFICNGCRSARKWNTFVYHCSLCKFDLDVGCASLTERKVKHPSHHHLLAPLRKKILALCDACGTTHPQGIFYHCTTCAEFGIHRECASLPMTIHESVHHHHPLTLAYSIPSQYSKFYYFCDICNRGVDQKYWVYYCGQCRYFAHVNCVTSKTEPFMSILLSRTKDDMETKNVNTYRDVVHLPVHDETVNLISHFRKVTTNEKTTDHGELNHFSHDHPLILFHVQGNEDEPCFKAKLCEACVKPISVAPFYRCTTHQCNFFLHKCCAELPVEVTHPCHPQHPLTLLLKKPEFLNLFWCDGCKFYCNGFTYSCVDCNYYLDVECGSLPSTIKHEAHKNHHLSLKNEFSSHCNVCYKGWVIWGFSYGCETCSFELHTSCALSPRTIRHRYDELHPFILTYSPVEDHSDDYYCDICERELNPKWWFYHCVKCDKSMHPTCVPPFDEWSHIKFGGTHTIKTHPHPLTLVPLMGKGIQCNSRQVISEGTKCDHCRAVFPRGHPFAFKCFQCYFKLCFICGGYRWY